MSLEIMPLLFIAALTGIIHTLLGPDHYVPFIAMAKAQSWSRKKTVLVTFLCGLGHILGAVVIAYLALGLRFSLMRLEIIETFRSDIAAWALIAFGCVYFVWGMKKLYREKRSAQDLPAGPVKPVLWALFVIFVVGPCEPVFFLMTHPVVAGSTLTAMLVIGVFSITTLATMLTTVLGASYGLSFLNGKPVMKFVPAVCGVLIMACGVGIKFLGL